MLAGLDGDIRVQGDTILVTDDSAPQADRLQQADEQLPPRLVAENLAAEIPWLDNVKLDFRFKWPFIQNRRWSNKSARSIRCPAGARLSMFKSLTAQVGRFCGSRS